MRKEAAHGRLTGRESVIEFARGPHTTRNAARQEASPQIMRRSIRIAAGPQTAKYARRIADDPQAHHRFRRARQAVNRRHASEAPPPRVSWRIARPNAVVVVSAMYENGQTLPLPSMYGKNLTFKTGGVDATGLEEPLSLIE